MKGSQVAKKNMEAPKRRRGGWRAIVLCGVLLGAAGFAAGYALAPEPTPDWAEAVTLAGSTIEVSEREYVGDRRAPAQMLLSPEATLVSPTFGVVRATTCSPGQTLRSGEAVFMADDNLVIALHTEVPLFRDLTQGMRGDDVASLQSELIRLELMTGEADGRFDARTSLAVRDLWRAADGPTNLRFIPFDRLIWLDAPSVTQTACQLTVGQRVSPGDPVLVAGGSLDGLNVSMAGLSAEDLVVTAIGMDETTPLPADGAITDRAFLDAFEGLFQFQQARNEGMTEVTLGVRLATPLTLTAVPPGVIYDQEGPQGCVIADGSPMAITVVTSELGQSLISAPAPIHSVTIQPVDPQPCR